MPGTWHAFCYIPVRIFGSFRGPLEAASPTESQPTQASARRCPDGKDRRRRDEDGEGKRSQVRRLPLHRHPRQRTARHRAGIRLRRRQVHRRPRLRRLVDRRLEGHRGVRHAADAGPEHRQHRPVLRRADADPDLRRARAGRRQALRARPAFAGQARRGLHEGLGPRRRRPSSARSPSSSSSTACAGAPTCPAASSRSNPKKRPGTRGKEYEHGNSGYRPGRQGRLLPGAAGRQLPGHALRDVPDPRVARHPGRSPPPRSRQRRPDGARHQVQHAGAARRLAAAAEVRDPERRARLRQDRDLHAEADRRRQRLRHARAPVGLEGRQEPVRRRRLRRPVGVRAVLHRRHHQARARAERDHQPGHQQLQAPGAGLRSAGEAGLLGEEPLGLDPHPLRREPEGPAHRGPLPGSDLPTRTSPSRRC